VPKILLQWRTQGPSCGSHPLWDHPGYVPSCHHYCIGRPMFNNWSHWSISTWPSQAKQGQFWSFNGQGRLSLGCIIAGLSPAHSCSQFLPIKYHLRMASPAAPIYTP
jgi:hypothetical protein